MKLLLSGYKESKKIIPVCSYLLQKYLPDFFDATFLNYGELNVSGVGYHSLGNEQVDGAKSWASDLVRYLETLTDPIIAFALDDFLLSNPLNETVFHKLFFCMSDNPSIVTAKLGISPSYRPQDYTIIDHPLFLIHKDAPYTVTTQYCLWKREFLIELLKQVQTPWEFEVVGSQVMNRLEMRAIGSIHPALDYVEESSLHGIDGGLYVYSTNNQEIQELLHLGLIPDSLELRTYTYERDLQPRTSQTDI